MTWRLIFPIVKLWIVVPDERILELLSDSSVVSLVNFSLSRNCFDGLYVFFELRRRATDNVVIVELELLFSVVGIIILVKTIPLPQAIDDVQSGNGIGTGTGTGALVRRICSLISELSSLNGWSDAA
jgi:hypothetical protein